MSNIIQRMSWFLYMESWFHYRQTIVTLKKLGNFFVEMYMNHAK